MEGDALHPRPSISGNADGVGDGSGVPRCDHLLVGSNDLGWRPTGNQLTVVHQRDAVAEFFDRHQVVRDEEHRRSRSPQLGEPIEALPLEGSVADGEHLVDEQHVRLDVDRHREAEPDVHPGRVVLHRLVDEPLEPRRTRRSRRSAWISRRRSPSTDRVHVDVLATGELGMEAGPQLNAAPDTAGEAYLSGGQGGDARQHLSMVLFPAPLWPIRPSVSPRPTSNVTSLTAQKSLTPPGRSRLTSPTPWRMR